MSKIILDLCGGTGSWSKPYRDAGYDVRLVTLPDNDVRLYIPPKNVYGILSAPPCTHFASSGSRWWKIKGLNPLLDGLSVTDACLRIIYVSKPKFWALENPVGRLRQYIGDPKLLFHPYMYGDAYTKKTLLWGEFNLPKKSEVPPVFKVLSNGKRMSEIHYTSFKLPPNERQQMRSITPNGFAIAFFEANQ